MTDVYDNVIEFHTAFGVTVNTKPTYPDNSLRLLRAKLLLEELGEVLVELGVAAELVCDGYSTTSISCELMEPEKLDFGKLAKELEDLNYVLQGTKIVLGFPRDAVAEAVHKSNMSKLGVDGKPVMREDGKVLKGENYTPASVDIDKVFKVLADAPSTINLTRLSLFMFLAKYRAYVFGGSNAQ